MSVGGRGGRHRREKELIQKKNPKEKRGGAQVLESKNTSAKTKSCRNYSKEEKSSKKETAKRQKNQRRKQGNLSMRPDEGSNERSGKKGCEEDSPVKDGHVVPFRARLYQ